jgi:5-methylcytosine-specific restriction enzyme subunit McrC
MQNLLWMLEVANFQDLAETQTAHLDEAPTSFFDLFAYLLGKNLLPELQRGIAHSYIAVEGDCRAVRGRIKVAEQLTRNWNRYDRISCAWDEFTPDTAMNRLLKCACRFLAGRVNYSEAARLLKDCQTLLGDVEDVDPSAALRDAARCRFDRSQMRFSTAFDLARRLLRGIGHNLGVGTANTFVFLMDMNAVFEKYVHAVLESHFSTNVEQQKFLGRLFNLPSGGIHQFADFFWKKDNGAWIGDAKYKHLARGQNKPLRFEQLDFDRESGELSSTSEIAGRILDSNDVRQLTVYAELATRLTSTGRTPQLILLYPFVGSMLDCAADRAIAWNGSCFWLMPVLVKKQRKIGDAIHFAQLEMISA